MRPSFARLASAGVLLAACGSDPSSPSRSPDEAASGASAYEVNGAENDVPRLGPPGYAVHEWGLIDATLDGAMLHAVSGPGHFTGGPTLGEPQASRGTGGLMGRKPVLYVHLGEHTERQAFTAKVETTVGSFPEFWPPAAVRNRGTESAVSSLTWRARASRSNCSNLEYPTIDSPTCAVADGYCEVAELGLFETSDGACLEVEGQRSNNLFYRASLESTLPLRVTRSSDSVIVENIGSRPLPGRILRVRRDTAGEHTVMSYAAMPAPSESVELACATGQDRAVVHPAPTGYGRVEEPPPLSERNDGPALMEELDAHLISVGLTAPEREAFARAWTTELTGGIDLSATALQDTHISEAPFLSSADVLLYWLGPEDVQELLPLSFDPAPTAIRRGMLVRVNLSVPTYLERHRSSLSLPRIRHGRMESVSGTMSPEVARRLLRRNVARVRDCFERHGGVASLEEIRMSYEIEVDSFGAVTDLRILPNPAVPATFRLCITAALRRIEFPEGFPGRTRGTYAISRE